MNIIQVLLISKMQKKEKTDMKMDILLLEVDVSGDLVLLQNLEVLLYSIINLTT